MNTNKKGFVQIYTGDGKGKTTAAVGLSARALGAGLKVYFAQFIKGRNSSEFKSLNKAGGVRFVHRCFGTGHFIFNEPTEEDYCLAIEGIETLKDILKNEQFDLIVADEIITAFTIGLLKIEDLFSLIECKPDHIELVFTGRQAPEKLIEKADLVSELQEIKHYFKVGTTARLGFEF